MKRLIISVVMLGALAAACGQEAGSLGGAGGGAPTPTTPGTSPTDTPTTTPSGSPPTSTPPTTSPPSPSGETFTYELWFAHDTGLFVTKRTEAFDPGVGRIALTGLLEGPSAPESAAGVSSTIPGGTELNGLTIDDGVATVDLSAEYAQSGGSAEETMRLAQVVYTITQFPTVSGVLFELDGDPVDVFGSHGIVLDGPQTRDDYADQLPPILVQAPLVGQRIDSPVTVSGTANVFEATVSIRVRDAGGTVIASTFTTATCGTGCRGDYSTSVSYTVSQDQQGTIEVFESSAEDGSPLHLVSIPVTLTA